MATYPIKSLGALGVIADQAPTDLPPNAFTDAMNARFVEQRVFKTGGCTPVSYVDADKNLNPLSFISMPFDYFSGGNSFLVVGDSGKLYKLTNEELIDISRKVPTVTKKASATISIHPVVTAITPKETSVTMDLNKTHALEVELSPKDVRVPKLTWTVSNTNYGTVSVNAADSRKATLTSKGAEGTFTVTVSTPDGSISAVIGVAVVNAATGIFLNKDKLTVRKGGTNSIVATSQKTPVTWLSSNPNIATVTTGTNTTIATITGKAAGVATVTANNGSKTVSCEVTVIPQIDKVELNESSIQINRGTSYLLKATVTPSDATNQKVTWSATGTNIVSLEPDGLNCTVKGLTAGSTVVTVTTEEGTRKATCNVNVELSATRSFTTSRSLKTQFAEALSIRASSGAIAPVAISEDDIDTLAVSTSAIDTTEMKSGNPFYDYSNVMDMEGFARASLFASVPLTGVTLDVKSADLDVGEDLTITATVAPANADDLVYNWVVDKGGYVSVDTTTKPAIKISALKQGDITITCTVSQMTQRDYEASEDRPWYHAIISNCAVATTYYETPQVKEFESEYFVDLPGWGEQTVVDDAGNPSVRKYNWKCDRVRAFNNRLFALNMREANASGVVTHYPLRLRWSNFAKENKAPTLWDDYAYDRATTSDAAAGITGQVEALEDGYAGYIDLADSNGNLMEMLPLKDYLFVYTEFETYVGSPTMNSYQPLMFKKLFNDSGILAPDCAVEVEGQHFVVTQNDIILHNGASKKSIASNRVKNKIINEVCQVNPLATKVHLHQDKKEVWILYVGPGEPKESWACTKAAVWNYEFDTWSFRSIPYSQCIGLVDPPVLEKGPTWTDFQNITWDDESIKNLVWRKDATNFHRRIVIVGSFMKGFYQVDVGPMNYWWDRLNEKVVEEPLKMVLTRSGIDFDNVTNEWNQKHVNAFRPQTTGQGKLTFVAGGTQYSNEEGHEHTTRPFIIGRDRKVCVRLNHPYLFYNVIDNDVDSTASLNGLTIEFSVGGRR